MSWSSKRRGQLSPAEDSFSGVRSDSMMKICIIGGGNVGTLMAAEFSSKGEEVWVYTSGAAIWASGLTVTDNENNVVIADARVMATDDLAAAVEGAAYIFVTYPTYLLADLCRRLLPLVEPGQRVGLVPGACGELFLHPVADSGAILFGLQRVHSVARLETRGKRVKMLGRKPSVSIAAIPASAAPSIADDLSRLFEMPCAVLPNYLALTLRPSNPILHTSRIRTMFAGWHEGISYSRNFLFYEEWTDSASELMLDCDGELQALCAHLPLDLSSVKPLTEHYESPNVQAMTWKLSHIPAFKGMRSPMKRVSTGGWVPDFSSRYFRADFDYGLRAIRSICHLSGLPCPNIDSVVEWYESVSHERSKFVLPWSSADEMVDFYRAGQ